MRVTNSEISSDYTYRSGITCGTDYDFKGISGKFANDPRGEFHIFTIIWIYRHSISWAIDGNVYHTENITQCFESQSEPEIKLSNVSQPFDLKFKILIDNKVKVSKFGQTNTSTENQLIVDYVRMFTFNATNESSKSNEIINNMAKLTNKQKESSEWFLQWEDEFDGQIHTNPLVRKWSYDEKECKWNNIISSVKNSSLKKYVIVKRMKILHSIYSVDRNTVCVV
jgi:hypothetical protein